MIIHVNNGKGYFYVVEEPSTHAAWRNVIERDPDFFRNGTCCFDIVEPGGGGAVGKWFDKIGGPYAYTPQAKGIRFDDRAN